MPVLNVVQDVRTFLASASLPCSTSQRGDSGMKNMVMNCRRAGMEAMPSMALKMRLEKTAFILCFKQTASQHYQGLPRAC